MNIKVDTVTLLEEQGIEFTETEASDYFKEWIAKRLEPLQKKINKEESKRDCYVMIHMMPPREQWYLPVEKQDDKIRVTMNGYSTDLADKMYHTIADGKMAILTKRIPLTDMSNN